MVLGDVEDAALEFRLRHPEANAIDALDGDAVNAVGRPYLLHHDVVVLDAVESYLAVGDAVDVDIEEGVEIAVVAVVEERVLSLLGVGCRQVEDGHQREEQAHNVLS